jgi:hypothetical protein
VKRDGGQIQKPACGQKVRRASLMWREENPTYQTMMMLDKILRGTIVSVDCFD